MKRIALLAIVSILCSSPLVAQVLTPAATIGEGNKSILTSQNRLYVDDVVLNIEYVQYVRGMTPNFDFYASVGGTHILGEEQAWVGVGGNYRLFHAGRFDVSSFNILSTPLHDRAEASTLLLNSALITSVSVTDKVSLWTGMNTLWPIGARYRGLFTPPERLNNVPLGMGFVKGRWGIFVETDLGHLRAWGVALSYS